MGFFDFGTIFFLVAAVVIFFQLRNVLGRRTGNERPPFDPYTAARARDKDAAPAGPENVVSLPKKRTAATDDEAYKPIDAVAKPGTDLNKGLRAIKDADPDLRPEDLRRRRQDGLRDDRHGLCRRRPQDAEEPAVARGL